MFLQVQKYEDLQRRLVVERGIARHSLPFRILLVQSLEVLVANVVG